MQDPRVPHLNAAYRVLRYLKAAPGQGIFLSSTSKLHLTAYCDSDWATYPTTRQSTSGYVAFLGHIPISWKSKKQGTVSCSSAQAEYRVMASVTSELLWLCTLLLDLKASLPNAMSLICDNEVALHIAANPVFHERTKHIKIDCHFIRDRLLNNELRTSHVCSSDQIGDLFTKTLSK